MSMDFFEKLISEVEKRSGELQKWRVQATQTDRREFYLLQMDQPVLDQIRSVSDSSYSLMLAVTKPNGSIGSAEMPVFKSQNLTEAVNQLMEKARLAEEKIWDFALDRTTTPSKQPQVAYEPFFRDFELSSQILVDKFRSSISAEKQGVFNSAELFLSAITDRVALSSGKRWESQRTKIYAEVCFSSDLGTDAQEYLIYRMGAHPEQIDFRDLIRTSVHMSVALKQAQLPKSGNYQVMVDAEVLGQLIMDSLHHLDSSQKYYGLPFIEKSQPFIPNYEGPSFEIVSNPDANYLFGSRAFDLEGNLLKNIPLVQNNQVVNHLTSKKYSEYLKIPVTTALGNIEILCDGEDPAEWRNRPTLEILQFSGLFSNPRDLSFSSEIRLARLWAPGLKDPTYIKGGSLSGKFQENFRNLRFSKERSSVNLNEESLGCRVGYIGPAFALLNDVVISS